MRLLLTASVLLTVCSLGLAQEWHENYWGTMNARRKCTLAGNRVNATSYNDGTFGSYTGLDAPSVCWPTGTNNKYLSDLSFLVGCDYWNPLLARSVVNVTDCKTPRGRYEVNPSNSSEYWTWTPLEGFANPYELLLATSTNPESWPMCWPDNGSCDTWNGVYGEDLSSLLEESVYWLDDSSNREFLRTETAYRDSVAQDIWTEFFPGNPETAEVPLIAPHWNDWSRGGMGLKVSVRTMAWNTPLLQDALFLIYDIHNTGELELNHLRIGCPLGTMIGGQADMDDDINTAFLEENLVISSDMDDMAGDIHWVPVEEGVCNIGRLAFSFLETPSAISDWIDNDRDAQNTTTVLDATTLADMLTDRNLVEGEAAVLIDYTNPAKPRRVAAVPAEAIQISYQGTTLWFGAGQSVVEIPGNLMDDNFNGLIDENELDSGKAYIDFHQLIESPPGPGEEILIDPDDLANAYPMIDESERDGIDNDGDWQMAEDDLGADGLAGTGDSGEGDGQPTLGEPNFEHHDPEEKDQTGLASVDEFLFVEFSSSEDPLTWRRMHEGIDSSLGTPNDTDYLMSTGTFSLLPGESTRLVAALFFGSFEEDVLSQHADLLEFAKGALYDLETLDVKPPETQTTSFELGEAYPNPFNPMTTIPVVLNRAGELRLGVYNLRGQLVRELHRGELPAGHHNFNLDGSALASGCYFLRATAGEFEQVRKCLLLK